MNNWEKIIEGYSKKPDNNSMKLITATVTSVTDDFYHADVKLITGQDISNLTNYSLNKLRVGQNVEVGYKTTPQAGWIQTAHGEPDPIRQGGGGVEVDTAVVYDEDDLHDWVATEELIEDISANTKLLYGGHQKTVAVQGYSCRYSTAALDDDDADNFGTKIELDAWYRADAASAYVLRHYVIELFVNEITTSTSGGVTSDRYVFGFTISRFVPNSSTAEATQAFRTANVTNPTDAFIVMQVNSMSFVTEFTKTWGGTVQTASTPYGYIQLNQMPITVGVLTAASPTAVTYPTIYPSGSSTSTTAFLNERGSTSNNDQYRCIPLESTAEKCFDLALTKRSEPTGGGN